MVPALDEWTIVIVGSWNVAILNPEWVGREVLEVPNVEMELLFGNMRPSLRISSPQVSVIPTSMQVVINPRHATDESLQAAERAAIILLDKLRVTPITAIGINFAYNEEAVPPGIAGLFTIADT